MLKPADAVIHTLPECPSFGQLVPEIPPIADPGRFKAGEAAGWKAGKGGTAQPLPPSDVHSNRPIDASLEAACAVIVCRFRRSRFFIEHCLQTCFTFNRRSIRGHAEAKRNKIFWR